MLELRIRKSTLTILFIIIAMHNFFYLAPSNIGPISYADILCLASLVIVFLCFSKDTGHFFTGYFSYIVLVVPVLILLSSIAAWINYGQPIISGILTQRYWLSTILLYFVFIYYIDAGELDYDFFVKIMYGIVICELIIYFAQYFLSGTVIFLNTGMNERYGTVRLYCNTNYMVLVALIAFEKLLKREKVVLNAGMVISVVAYFLLVNKGRSATMAFLLGLVVVLLFSNVPVRYKLIVGTVTGLVGVNYLISSSVVQDFISVIFGGEEDGTYNVRLYSQDYYLEVWGTSWFSRVFGYGYGNSSIYASQVATGATQGYGYADNGIFGFVSCYGICGILWYVAFIYKRIRAWWQQRNGGTVVILAIVIMMIAQYQTVVSYFYTSHSFEAVMAMVFIELALRKKDEVFDNDIS